MRFGGISVFGGLLLAAVQAGATERHVPSEYATIQEAIYACDAGDAVIIADGTYTGSGNKNLEFGHSITVRSASGSPANCIIDCEYSGRGFNCQCGGTVIAGLTVRNGRPPEEPDGGRGGGIVLEPDNCVVINCIITGNIGRYTGGGIYCTSSCTVMDCLISGNEVIAPAGNGYGGGAYLNSGGALHHCTVAGNTADYGGGISGGGYGVAESCNIQGNFARYGGGGACNMGYLYGSEVTGNSTGWYGGGVVFWPDTSLGTEIRSCTIADNTAGWYGGGVYMLGVRQSWIADSVLSGNFATYGRQLALDDRAIASVAYSLIDGEEAIFVWGGAFVMFGDGILAADPRFVDPTVGNYGLQMDSPCVDAGSNEALPLIDADGDGHADDPIPWDCAGSMRVARLTTDIGAYEIPYADLNCDKAVNAFDIDPFVLALTDPAAHAAAYPDCDSLLGDTNADGVVNAFDIDPFVQLLTAGS